MNNASFSLSNALWELNCYYVIIFVEKKCIVEWRVMTYVKGKNVQQKTVMETV